MSKDKRYTAIRSMVETGILSGFKEIFDIIPKTLVSNDLGMNYQTFTRKVNEPDLFTLRELAKIAHLMAVKPMTLVELILKDLERRGRKSSR